MLDRIAVHKKIEQSMRDLRIQDPVEAENELFKSMYKEKWTNRSSLPKIKIKAEKTPTYMENKIMLRKNQSQLNIQEVWEFRKAMNKGT